MSNIGARSSGQAAGLPMPPVIHRQRDPGDENDWGMRPWPKPGSTDALIAGLLMFVRSGVFGVADAGECLQDARRMLIRRS